MEKVSLLSSEVSSKSPNKDNGADKRGEKRWTDAVEDEGQTSHQPSETMARASSGTVVRRAELVEPQSLVFGTAEKKL